MSAAWHSSDDDQKDHYKVWLQQNYLKTVCERKRQKCSIYNLKVTKFYLSPTSDSTEYEVISSVVEALVLDNFLFIASPSCWIELTVLERLICILVESCLLAAS